MTHPAPLSAERIAQIKKWIESKERIGRIDGHYDPALNTTRELVAEVARLLAASTAQEAEPKWRCRDGHGAFTRESVGLSGSYPRCPVCLSIGESGTVEQIVPPAYVDLEAKVAAQEAEIARLRQFIKADWPDDDGPEFTPEQLADLNADFAAFKARRDKRDRAEARVEELEAHLTALRSEKEQEKTHARVPGFPEGERRDLPRPAFGSIPSVQNQHASRLPEGDGGGR